MQPLLLRKLHSLDALPFPYHDVSDPPSALPSQVAAREPNHRLSTIEAFLSSPQLATCSSNGGAPLGLALARAWLGLRAPTLATAAAFTSPRLRAFLAPSPLPYCGLPCPCSGALYTPLQLFSYLYYLLRAASYSACTAACLS